MTTPLPECHGLVGYTEAQMVEYGKSEYERGLLAAMNATIAFGKTGEVIAMVIKELRGKA